MKYVRGPKSQLEKSSGKPNVINRAYQIRRDDDKIRDYTNGLYDIDYAIQYYIKNIIKPTVVENGRIVPVPVMYGSPEQWTSVRKMAYIRDNKGKMVVPLIAYTQTGGSKNTEMPVDKLDANNPHLFYTYGQRWSKKNNYDNFNVLVGKNPSFELFRIIVPDYLNLTYEIVIWTTYMEQMNKIIEAIVYSEGAYWGEEERGKFRTTIADYSKTVEVSQGADRYCKTTMSLTVYGYIIPDTINKQLSMKEGGQKIFSNSRIIFTQETDKTVPQMQRAYLQNEEGGTTDMINITEDLSQLFEFQRIDYELVASDVNVASPYSIITFPSASLMAVPAGATELTINDFILYLNGQKIDRKYYSIPTEESGSIYVVVNTSQLGIQLSGSDNITIRGKFANSQSFDVYNDVRLRGKQLTVTGVSFHDVTLTGATTITGSLNIIGDTTSSGPITLSTGSQLITDTGQIGSSGSLDSGEF